LPSTAAYDRGLKFSHDRSLSSLEEYVLIDPDTRTSDVHSKGAGGLWVLHPLRSKSAI
jgi:Uma2 family endonuclease